MIGLFSVILLSAFATSVESDYCSEILTSQPIKILSGRTDK